MQYDYENTTHSCEHQKSFENNTGKLKKNTLSAKIFQHMQEY
jgi:hypothetical protein